MEKIMHLTAYAKFIVIPFVLATAIIAIAANSQEAPKTETMKVNCNCQSDKCKPVEPVKPVRGLW